MEISRENIEKLIKEIDKISSYSAKLEKSFSSEIIGAHPSLRKSARNLLHYLALRNHDIRHLQQQLAGIGLSSLGRCEAHVKASLYAVRNQLYRLIHCSDGQKEEDYISFQESNNLLEANTAALLGPPRNGRDVRIMITLSNEAADDYTLIHDMLIKGMDCARINCAHDNKEVWIRMIDNINRAKTETGLNCKILMDLAGIKLRTGPLKSKPQVLLIKAKRDFYGKLTGPAKIWLAPSGIPAPAHTDISIPVDPDWMKELQPGDKVHFTDTRGKKRQFEITTCEKNGCHAEIFKRSYIESGTNLFIKDKKRQIEPSQVGQLSPVEQPIILRNGDILILHKAAVPGEDAKYDENGFIIEPAHISCSFPEIFNDVKAGEPVLFNDGKIEGIITSFSPDMLVVKITHAKNTGSKLGADKGINFPKSNISMNGLSQKDLDDLHFIARHADIINASFVNDPQDVFTIQEELKKLNASHIGLMLKIETERGFKNLPMILLAAMKSYPTGVMIARGDLAVECGWERLAEIQEEILWLCEAAHVPVVWATQVLESLAKKGSPSRAEITDAAMSQRADCVMLNKGPHILETIEMLSNILGRMQGHQHKKTSILRNLKVSEIFNIED